MSEYKYKLRPHHGMCMAFFKGKGYSEDFTKHMTKIVAEMKEENPKVRLTVGADEICSHCPHERDGLCGSGQSAADYDRGVLEYTGLSEGQVIAAREFLEIVSEKIIFAACREKICGGCMWNLLCTKDNFML